MEKPKKTTSRSQLASAHFTRKPKHSKQLTTSKLSKADELAQQLPKPSSREWGPAAEGVALKIRRTPAGGAGRDWKAAPCSAEED